MESDKPLTPDTTQDYREPGERTARLKQVLEQCLTAIQSGEVLDRQKLLSEHPELAEQLEAWLAATEFILGRAISARRESFVERTLRWVNGHRHNVALGGSAVLATLFLVLVAGLGNYLWNQSRSAELMLKTPTPPLVAELLDGSERIVPPMTIPTQHPVEVNSGEFQLRLSGLDRLSQSYSVAISPGRLADWKLDLNEDLIWGGLEIEKGFELVDFVYADGRPKADPLAPPISALSPFPQTDLIELTSQGLRCIGGATGKARWELILKANDADADSPRAGNELLSKFQLEWPWPNLHGLNFGIFKLTPWIVSEKDAPGVCAEKPPRASPLDVNRDGISDFVVAARHQTWAIAVSGADGQVLWVAARGTATEQPSGDGRFSSWTREGGESTVYSPELVDDQDGDGVAELLVMFISKRDGRALTERWVELLSGANGQAIWRYDLPREWFDLPAGAEVPERFRWHYGRSGGYSSSGQGWHTQMHYIVRQGATFSRTGAYEYLPSRPIVAQPFSSPSDQPPQDAKQVVFTAGTKLVQLDLKTGKAADARNDLTIHASLEPRYADFDGDRVTDLLLIESLPAKSVAQPRGPITIPALRVSVWSGASRTLSWSREITAAAPASYNAAGIAVWPVVADVDNDGASEVIVPDGQSLENTYAAPWGKLALLDGRTGKPRWHAQVFNMDRQLDQFLAGPDIDADGFAEIYVASQWARDFRLFVDCLSGKDGQRKWRSEQQVRSPHEFDDFALQAISWYEESGDGWPQLVAPLYSNNQGSDRTFFISAGTGELTHTAMGISATRYGDVDSDGIGDLILYRERGDSYWREGGTVQAYRGSGREAWRAILDAQVVVGDLNGDGIGDLVNATSPSLFVARSGADGSVIWQAEVAVEGAILTANPVTTMEPRRGIVTDFYDLNGDGTPDILLRAGDASFRTKQPVIVAISGRNGRRLWNSPFTVQRCEGVIMMDCRDLNGDGKLEVIFAAPCDYLQSPLRNGPGLNTTRIWLAVVNGDDGTIQWIRPLTELQRSNGINRFDHPGAKLEATYADLNGDQTLDVVLPMQIGMNYKVGMAAFNGKDSEVLWRRPLPDHPNVANAFRTMAPAVADDIDGDGKPEVVVLDAARRANGEIHLELTAIRGETGEQQWQWSGPFQLNSVGPPQDDVALKDRLRPILVRRPNGKAWIAIAYVEPYGKRAVRVFNEKGEAVSEQVVEQDLAGFGTARLWLVDANRDGVDELLTSAWREVGGRVAKMLFPAAPDKLDESLWTENVAINNLSYVFGILPSAASGDVIVLNNGSDGTSLRGVDASSGKLRWKCVGPIMQFTDGAMKWQLLNVPSAETPPYVLYQCGDKTFVRQGISFDSESAWQVAGRAAPVTSPVGVDSRMLRPLPWRPQDFQLQELPTYIGWSAFYGITLAAAPMIFIGSLVRRWQWGLRTMLMLPVVAGCVLMALTWSPEDRDFEMASDKLLVAYGGAGPILFTAGVIAVWLRRGKWRRVIIWVTLVVTLASIFMMVALSSDQYRSELSGETYSWDGWYFIFLPMLYLMSWGTLLGIAGLWLVQWVRGKDKRIDPLRRP